MNSRNVVSTYTFALDSWLRSSDGFTIMVIRFNERHLDAGRFTRFTKSVCDYTVMVEIRKQLNLQGSWLGPMLDWIADNVRSRWSLSMWHGNDTFNDTFDDRKRWFACFSFGDRADAIFFKLKFGDSGS